jgi:hypothetical protein
MESNRTWTVSGTVDWVRVRGVEQSSNLGYTVQEKTPFEAAVSTFH